MVKIMDGNFGNDKSFLSFAAVPVAIGNEHGNSRQN